MTNDLRKTGFVPPPVIDDTHFVLGGLSNLPQNVIRPDGNWEKFLPSEESQLEKTFDSDGCTVYGTLNAIETLEKSFTNNDVNYSERFIYNIVGITPPGSDPHLVATTIRGSGLISESELPGEVSSLAEFMRPRPMTVDLVVKGQKWTWTLGHEWIITPTTPKEKRVSILKESLLKGTVCISVTAWYKNNAGLYYSPQGQPNEHWTHVYDVDETAINAFDSYRDAVTGSFKKRLTLDHDISWAKRYSLTRKLTTQQRYWFMEILKNIWDMLFKIQKETDQLKIEEAKEPPVDPQKEAIVTTISVTDVPKYLWDTVERARHSVRVICDEEGLNLEQKNTLCATVGGESGWQSYYLSGPKKGQPVTRENFVHGKLWSTDRGIAQWNDYYHGNEISPDEAQNNPEKSIRLMCKYWLRGMRETWIAWKDGSYRKYMI